MKRHPRKSLAALFAVAFFGFGLATQIPVQAGERNLTVVELFTSQGCSSCPPADAFLGRLAQQKNILALSFHVDYWDYIGWRDPYASGAFTQRQKGYASHFRKSFVYTPQMVVQGVTEATGSDEYTVKRLIKQAGSAPDVPIDITQNKSGGLTVTISAGRRPAHAGVWVALFDREHKTAVKRGENRGRVIHNYNVVRHFQKIGDWRGNKMVLNLPASVLKSHAGDACAIFLQSEMKGPILGASTIALHRPN